MSISAIASSAATWQTSAASSASSAGSSKAKGPEATQSAVADLLGMSTDDLSSALQSGKTMNDLAKDAGVSSQDLLDTIESTVPTTSPDGTSVDTADFASKIASGEIPQPPSGSPPPKPAADAASGLDSLSSSLGVSSSDLLQRLTDGTGIADLLQSNPSVAAQLSSSGSKGAIVDGYA